MYHAITKTTKKVPFIINRSIQILVGSWDKIIWLRNNEKCIEIWSFFNVKRAIALTFGDTKICTDLPVGMANVNKAQNEIVANKRYGRDYYKYVLLSRLYRVIAIF